MRYLAKNVDTAKALEYIRNTKRDYREIAIREQEKVERYYAGIQKGIEIAESLFFSSDYEKNE